MIAVQPRGNDGGFSRPSSSFFVQTFEGFEVIIR